MRNFERTQLMHAVLDGEATPDEALELERLLGADPAARTEFEELKSLFEGLRRVPKAFPPEGLVAAVMASVPRRPAPPDYSSQLFSKSGVISQSSMETRGANPGKSVKVQQVSQPGPYLKGQNVSELKNGFFSKRKVWIGGGIAAAAAVLAVSFGIDFPPGVKDTVGTIVPAQRYRAPQNTADDVKLGNQASTQSTLPRQADAANSAADSAAKSAAVSAAKSAADSAAMSAADAAAKSAADNAAKSAADNAAKSAADNASKSAADSAAKKAAYTAAKSAADAAAQSAADAAAKSAADSAAKSAADNAAKSAADNAAKSAADSAAKTAAKSAADSAAKSAADSAAKSAADSAAKSSADSAAKSAADSAAKSAADNAAKSSANSTAK
jgi:hypothetical protein